MQLRADSYAGCLRSLNADYAKAGRTVCFLTKTHLAETVRESLCQHSSVSPALSDPQV